ncbi:envelope glycoprotein C [Gallid alphaherpesvirus 1]|uniref:Envelope glycoprotein C n=1 Tax=Infectious laryngotracheitis virus TaxID=10386 RepID=L7SS09_ILTV|nr:envelope glycoprotein C [Gallid alphaherpesvirus 1]ATD84161.1 envelope glycoprotein C [Gallid alphaherpesvirus 1]ATD84398.1 envelope glycoprotein C [Gallid alphaherpesvirus 1]ATD84477.1 envelope glycoprotein C [Gallid alphaherpesvirus 1]ATD84556.1 envelope glycoprotein C [Gallid alphaherpesvirus 1]
MQHQSTALVSSILLLLNLQSLAFEFFCDPPHVFRGQLGDPILLQCFSDRPLTHEESVKVEVIRHPASLVETALSAYGIPPSLDPWRATPRTLYTYDAATDSIKDLGYIGEDGINPPYLDDCRSGFFNVSIKSSMRSHMARYQWTASRGSTKLNSSFIDVFLARPPTTVRIKSEELYEDSDKASHLSVEALGAYPPSAALGTWMIHNASLAEKYSLERRVLYASGENGSVDQTWELEIRGEASQPLPSKIQFVYRWTPPEDFEMLRPETRLLRLTPSWISKPRITVQFVPPAYALCRAANIIDGRGFIEWIVDNRISTSPHQTFVLDEPEGKNIVTLMDVIKLPPEDTFQSASNYVCVIRGYEHAYRYLNASLMIDNLPMRQGFPAVAAIFIIISIAFVGGLLVACLGAWCWKTT